MPIAAQKLPLQVRLGIRDHFDKPTCPVQKAFKTIESTIGLKVVSNVEWDLILNELDATFPDKAILVPTVCSLVVAWCEGLSSRLDDDKLSAWTDEVVEKLESAGSLKVQIQISNDDYPSTIWLDEHSAFAILIPRRSTFTTNTASSSFGAAFEKLFRTSSENTTTEMRSGTFAAKTNDSRQADNEWADVEEGSIFSDLAGSRGMPIMTPSVTTISRSNTFGSPTLEKMPSVNATPNPETLMRNLTPYMLYVTQRSSSRMIEQSSGRVFDQGSSRFGQGSTSTQLEQGGSTIVVQGTHEPTLQFLNEYLIRWVKRDHQDTRKCPLLRITLHESHFGLGLTHDTLSIEPYDTHQEKRGIQMNPTMIISIIENVLGYHCLPRVSASVWEFRRELPFKSV